MHSLARNHRVAPLREPFVEPTEIFHELEQIVRRGDFTLGDAVRRAEEGFARLVGARHAVGVNSGTDAVKLSLKALGVGSGDEVITSAYTFVATLGAICEIGARPVLVDCDETFLMDVSQVEDAVTERTRAIVPVHFAGDVVDMEPLREIANRRGLVLVEDACQAILSEYRGRPVGTLGACGAFSLHPLKNLSVWGDGGFIVTNDGGLDRKLRLLRNHGLAGPDFVEAMGYNSRLDTLQAVVAEWVLPGIDAITRRRRENAAYYDDRLSRIEGVRVPPRCAERRGVYYLYMLYAEGRDELVAHANARGIETKVHYPVPLYRQPGLAWLGYEPGRFPGCDRNAREAVSLPVGQHLEPDQLVAVADVISEFYA